MRFLVALGLLLALALVAPPAYADSPADASMVSDLSRMLVCQCGCTLTLEACNHYECGSREGMLASIRDMADKGMSKQAILDAFVAEYGEAVLSAPTKKGFNLTAWILPFAAIVGAAGAIVALLKLWVPRGRQPLPLLRITPEEEEKYHRRLEEELKGFGEG